MPHKLTGRDGRTVTIPDGGHGLQGSDGNMVAIPKGGHGLQFTSVFGSSQHRATVLKSGYIYQLYTYLRSQERADDPLSLSASGVFRRGRGA
jgi:hypothetical protein